MPEALLESFVAQLLVRHELDLFASATALIVEHHDPLSGFSQLIGPFPKDEATALAHIERLRAEEDPERDPNAPPLEYRIHLLFAP